MTKSTTIHMQAETRLEEDERAQYPWLMATTGVATIMATEHELDKLLSSFLSTLIETLEAADRGLLYLLNPEDGRLEVRAAQGYAPDPLKNIRLAPGEGICGKVFQSGEPALYQGIQ